MAAEARLKSKNLYKVELYLLKIIESAIIFWFKDVDCKSRNKVVSYFKEY